jgi:hypothetical protein
MGDRARVATKATTEARAVDRACERARRRPPARRALVGGLVCACPCGCASRTTAASVHVELLLNSRGEELCSECFNNIISARKTLCFALENRQK